MRKHDLYEKKQSAYRCYHSTETALLKVQNDLLVAMDKSCGVFLVLLDVSAAFDTIDHDNPGLSGTALAWMNSLSPWKVTICSHQRHQSRTSMRFLRDPSWDQYFLLSTHHQLELLLSVIILRYTSTRMAHKYIYFLKRRTLNLKQKHCEPSRNVSLKSDNEWR